MSEHIFAMAPSGRSKCRGCGQTIAKGTLRFGERLPNPFGDGDMTHWHHPLCAAHRRPESLSGTLDQYPGTDDTAPPISVLKEAAERALQHPRLQRMGVIEQASSGRARCRHCQELIPKDEWRIPLIFFNEDTYASSGFIHALCAAEYCDTTDVWPTIECFASALLSGPSGAEQRAVIQNALTHS